MMKFNLFLLIQFLSICFVFPQQQGSGRKEADFIRLPKESYRVFIAFQPDCPLKFDNVEAFLSGRTKSPVIRYVARNTSTRAIKYFAIEFYKSFTVGEWGKYGIGHGIAIGQKDGKGTIVLPANGVFESDSLDDVLVLDTRERVMEMFGRKISLENPVIVWFGKVNKVIFEDGTVFEDEKDLSYFFGHVDF